MSNYKLKSIRKRSPLLLCIGVIFAVVLYLWGTRPQLLMTKAKKIIEVPEWRNEKFTYGEHYKWLNPKEVLYSV